VISHANVSTLEMSTTHVIKCHANVLLTEVSGGSTGWVMNLRVRGRGFHSWSGHGGITTLGKLFTPCALVTKQYKLTLVKGRSMTAGKVIVGLASHWPCVSTPG